MSRTAAQLKLAVSGFMQRDPSTFLRTVSAVTWDVLLQSVNNARLYAERLIDFELAKVAVTIPSVSITDGALITTAVLYGTNTPVSLKKIITPFLVMNDGIGQLPIDLVTKRYWVEKIKRRTELVLPTDNIAITNQTYAPLQLMQQGNTVAVIPGSGTGLSGTFPVHADAIKWLPDYTTAGTENDFLLDFCFDWLMYKSIQELNFYVKEDERVQLSSGLVNDAWAAIVRWNTELIQSTADDITSLD